MYQMVEPVSINGVNKKILYVTNEQAEMIGSNNDSIKNRNTAASTRATPAAESGNLLRGRLLAQPTGSRLEMPFWAALASKKPLNS